MTVTSLVGPRIADSENGSMLGQKDGIGVLLGLDLGGLEYIWYIVS